MKDLPKLTHPYCTNDRCLVCLDDHLSLGKYLDKQTGRNDLDHLGKYHKWLSDNGIPNETEYGWAHPDAFLIENIRSYISRYTDHD